jgi:hypothetical protein
MAALPAINPINLRAGMALPAAPAENAQTRALFGDEAKRIAEAAVTIQWHRPSLHEADAPPPEALPVFSDPESAEAVIPASKVAGSATRGIILHKLMEEVLTGETSDAAAQLERRSIEVLAKLGGEQSPDPKLGVSPKERPRSYMSAVRIFSRISALPWWSSSKSRTKGKSEAN